MYLSDEQWQQFENEGYLRLGQVADETLLTELQQRIDTIMLGQADIDYDQLLMQLDSNDGAYHSAGPQTLGFKGSTLAYRKIENLEQDPLFLTYMTLPIFEEAARRIYGDIAISPFRAMFMNKPASRGTQLPLHQDRWRALDRDPLLTIYTSLDAATEENGCVEIVPGSHHKLLNPDHHSGFLTKEMANKVKNESNLVPLTLDAGEVVLMHNWLLHRSGVNQTQEPRRAFSVCLMDAETINHDCSPPQTHKPIFEAA